MGSGGSTGIGAGLGAGAGFLIGGPGGAAIGAGLGGQLGAGFDSANAADAMANRQYAQQQKDRDAAFYNAVSPEQMQQLQQNITLNNQDIARKQTLLASADPALLESGKQALALMQGKSAASLKPLQDQRAVQRQQLQSTLANQLGPDYATSSQGQAALNQFDQQTANTLAGAQQQAIGQYMGYNAQAEAAGNLNSNFAQGNEISNQYGNIAARKVNAITVNPVNPGLTGTGALMGSQAMGSSFGTLAGLGMMYASGGFNKKAPTAGNWAQDGTQQLATGGGAESGTATSPFMNG